MSKSLKLQKGGSAKEQATKAGLLLMVFGVLFFFLVNSAVGFILGGVGLILLLGGLGASE
jgi:hypothetical protein